MSLAPAERRALDTIEDALRREDRRLARMLTRFALPLTRGGLAIFVRRPGRLRRLIMSAVAVTAAALFVVATLNSKITPPICAAPTTASAAAAMQSSVCPPALPKALAASPARSAAVASHVPDVP
jgi:hypothetical protein